MLKENESVLGLDIEAEGIKLVELRKTLQRLEIVNAKVLTLPADSLKNGVMVKPKSIGMAVRDFIEANNIQTKKVVGVLNPSLTLIRLLRIPLMSELEMKAILETEANQYVDFKHKEKVIDFCLLEEINEEGIKKVNVLFAASLKETIDNFMRVAEEANLELIGIDVANLAIMRTLYGVNIKPSSLEPIVLVIINREDIQLCILKSNRLRFLHTVKIDIKEFITAREEFIYRLIFSIKLVLNYYSRAIYGQEEIHRIIVSINDISLKDIDKELTSRLEGFSIEKANHLGRLKIDDTIFPKDVKEDISLSFASSLGAVLRTEDTPDYPLSLNLIPLERQKRLLANRELALYVSALAILLATFVILASLFGINNLLMQRRISKLNRQLEEITPKLDKLVREYSKNVDLDKRINAAERIIKEVNKTKSKFSSSVLAETLVLVPENLWLTDISVEPKEENLLLTGKSLNEKPIFDYVGSLNNTGYFSKVEPLFAKTESETLNFLIKCQLKK